ncbi:hypothetical protein ACLB1T_13420 [Escherichia coli]
MPWTYATSASSYSSKSTVSNASRAPGKLTQPAICMADELTPSQFLELDKNHLKGLLL